MKFLLQRHGIVTYADRNIESPTRAVATAKPVDRRLKTLTGTKKTKTYFTISGTTGFEPAAIANASRTDPAIDPADPSTNAADCAL